MKKIVLVVAFLCGLVAYAQPAPPSPLEDMEKLEEFTQAPNKQTPSFEATIISAFKAGDAAKIAKFFGENVDLQILDKENLYSKSQAEHILKGFFADHIPSEFKIIHKGKSGQTDYIIGDLISDETKYRVKLNTKSLGQGMKMITSLSITVA